MKVSKRIIACLLGFVITVYTISAPMVAYATVGDAFEYGLDTIIAWITGSSSQPLGGWNSVDWSNALFSSNKPQNYYTTPTESVEDKYGNVTNYYRGGDTTTTKIIDSYNQTFNNIWNTTNTTNNYTANVKLNDFLNTYTTVNNDYTYNTSFKSWYYDQSTNNYTYDASQTYYNTDNSQYYISIDNSTDEYYLIDVQYSPTFVTVNYNYYNTNNTTNIGDVTNVYYFELTDGRNSSSLSADEVAGLDLGYDVVNYELVTDDPNTLSLQHFDGDYTDSSSYSRTFYSENRSSNYVDSGDFGKALQLPSGSAAGVTIPGLSDYDSLSFDFHIYYSDISNLGIYLGDIPLLQPLPQNRQWAGWDDYSDDGETFQKNGSYGDFETGHDYTALEIGYSGSAGSSTTLKSTMTIPTAYDASGYSQVYLSPKKYGYFSTTNSPVLYSSELQNSWRCKDYSNGVFKFTLTHGIYKIYRWTPSESVLADFSYDTYKSQWVSMRIVISGGQLYYFVNGDLVGSGTFTMPEADKFYIKSSGTLYLDELRITTGDMVSTGSYSPSSSPFDTNKVLALPETLTANTIYVRHSTPVSSWRIGGVRPSNPSTGFFYVPLYDDYTGGQGQLYDGSNWVDVDAMVYDGSTTKSVVGYQFTPMGQSADVDTDLEPGRPTQPGEDVDPDTCNHDWQEESSIDPSCVMSGSVTSKCSKCGTTKTETIPKLGHTWEVKTSVQTTYDDEGNIVTQGYTIYRCTVCGEEYKDTEGNGPPFSSTTDDSSSDDNWFTALLKKIADFFGSTVGALLELVGSVIDKILDSVITLAKNTLEKLTEVVNLFGSFGDALGVFWSWLPPEIVTVLVAGVTVIIFVALIKMFL